MRWKKGDILILIILVLSIASVILFQFFWPEKDQKIAVIKVDKEVYQTIPLDKNNERKEIAIQLSDGHFVQVVTEGEEIWFSESSCPDKICVKTGKISDVTQTIACLPNKTIAYIESAQGSDGKDKIDTIAN